MTLRRYEEKSREWLNRQIAWLERLKADRKANVPNRPKYSYEKMCQVQSEMEKELILKEYDEDGPAKVAEILIEKVNENLNNLKKQWL
jgi:hypothetical protein